MARSAVGVGLLAVLLTGCGEPPLEELPGVQVRYQPAAEGFWRMPYPHDLRGASPDLNELPGAAETPLLVSLSAAAKDLRGFPTKSVGWFPFVGEPGQVEGLQLREGALDDEVWLLDIDPDSPEQGRLWPVVFTMLEEDDYVESRVLAVAPAPGLVLREATQYAYVLRRSFGDDLGKDLGVSAAMRNLLAGQTPEVAWAEEHAELFTDLVATLESLEVSSDELAGASVFTTANVVAEMEELTDQLRERHPSEVTGLSLHPSRGLTNPNVCELQGEIVLPQFQRGEPLFDTEGLFEPGDDGLPIVQREETISVTITLPKSEMPAEGYPLVQYFHGSGGEAEELITAGPSEALGEPRLAGYGPAKVLADVGFAVAGSSLPVSPDRVPGATPTAYLNFSNLAAFRDVFRQGMVEQRILLDALLEVRIAPEALGECEGPTLPQGADAFFFDAERLVGQGQSMGGMYTNLIGAIEPRFGALVPTGAGGHWSRFILETSLLGEGTTRTVITGLLDIDPDTTYLHPALQIAQTAWEPVEPTVYTGRLAMRPLPGHPARSIYQPVGLDDSFFPPVIFDEMAVSYGNERAGDEIWSEMDDSLALIGIEETIDYPVQLNLVSEDGRPYTGVVVQYEGDGFSDPHRIYSQLDTVKRQFGCFLSTFVETGVATVPAPQPVDGPCPN